MNTLKENIIVDIEKLLNSYDDNHSTTINRDLLKFMDETTLKDILNSLLKQKENSTVIIASYKYEIVYKIYKKLSKLDGIQILDIWGK